MNALNARCPFALPAAGRRGGAGALALAGGVLCVLLQTAAAQSPLHVVSTLPAQGAVGVATGASIEVTFDAPIDPLTVDATTCTVRGESRGVAAGSFTFPSADSLRFVPALAFLGGESVEVTLSSGLRSAGGAALAATVFQFEVEVTRPCASFAFASGGQLPHGQHAAAMALGDVDGDGDLDALVFDRITPGESVLLLNDGQGGFVQTGQTFSADRTSDLQLGDLDGDGDLDAFAVGIDRPCSVFVNDGMGGFTAGSVTAPTRGYGVDLGDLDGDGDLDALVARGYDVPRLWINDGAGLFAAGQQLACDFNSDVELADLDGDGDLDAFVASRLGEKVWLNTGWGTLVASGQQLIACSQVALGDLDGDGDLDAFLIGGEREHRVWLNNGAGMFSDSGQLLGNRYGNSVDLGDLDGDGDLDAFVATSGGSVDQVWENDGAGTFTSSPQSLGFAQGRVTLGDLDGDGDLDAMIAAELPSTLEFWRNDCPAPACWITSPQDGSIVTGTVACLFDGVSLSGTPLTSTLEHSTDGGVTWRLATAAAGSPTTNPDPARPAPFGGVLFVWDRQADGVGVSAAEHTRLRLTTNDGWKTGAHSICVLATPSGSFGLVATSPAHAEVGVIASSRIHVTLDQAVEPLSVELASFRVSGRHVGPIAGSFGFPAPDQIEFTPAALLPPGETIEVSLSHSITSTSGQVLVPRVFAFEVQVAAACPATAVAEGGQALGPLVSQAVALGDVDRDGDLDAFVASSEGANRVWRSDGVGGYTDSGQALGSSVSLDVALGDLDGDGDLDAFVANGGFASEPNRVYRNDGAGLYSDSLQELGNSRSNGVELGDLDGDGDLDAFVVNDLGDPGEVWINDGLGQFADSGQQLEGCSARAVALGDLDGDGDLDAFVACWDGADRVWLNDGLGTFGVTAPLYGGPGSTDVELGDVNGDGDLDAFVARTSPAVGNQLWLGDGSGGFVDSGQQLGSSFGLAVALGDANGDGALDAWVGCWNQPDQVWLNDGVGNYTSSLQGLESTASYGIDVGDVDGDGDLDAFVASGGPDHVLFSECPPPTCTPAPGQLCGDCDGNAVVADVLDALSAAQLATGLLQPTPAQACTCDVDASGTLSVIDSLLIARMTAGLPIALTCP